MRILTMANGWWFYAMLYLGYAGYAGYARYAYRRNCRKVDGFLIFSVCG